MTAYDFTQLYESPDQWDVTQTNAMTEREAFAWYNRHGWIAFPVWVNPADPKERKPIGLPPGYHFDTLTRPTEEQIQAALAAWRAEWRVGLVLSKASGKLTLDVDDMAQWERFCAEYGTPDTLYAQSGRADGGLHAFFDRPDDERITPLGDQVLGSYDTELHQRSWSAAYPNIEVKSKGFVVAPPSVHGGTGKRYQWLGGTSSPAEISRDLMAARLEAQRAGSRRARVAEHREYLEVREEARRELDRLAYEEICGTRRLMSWSEVTAQPRPAWVYDGLLTRGVYGVAGPPEAGKSLLCRNWLCEVAASGQNVLYAPSEGQFDMAERFGAHPQFEAARPHLACLPEDAPLSLASREDVAWLLDQCSAGVALICFDMIYGFGVTDDNTVSDVGPVLGGCKRLAAELGCAVLITGHPGHGAQRRFRGTSMWRGAFDGEFHMAEGQFTCEKHKYADKKKIIWPYVVEYPHLRLVPPMEALNRDMQRFAQIAEDLRLHPGDADSVRATRLAPHMGLSAERIRKLISAHRKAGQDDR